MICSRQKDIEFTRNESSSWEYSKVAQKGYTPLPTWNVRIPVSGKSEGHVGILKNFVAAIRGEAELSAPASEGINSVELANAMLLSSYHDRPVSLPMDSAEYAGVLKKRIDESTFVKKTVKAAESSDDFSKSF